MHRRQGLIALFAAGLAACSGSVPVPTAARSTDPACASALVAVRGASTVNGLHRRSTSTQATAAWGRDGQLQLVCGVPALGPSTDRCQSVGGVDWVVTQARGQTFFTAFGRSPTVRVSLPGSNPTGVDVVLTSLAPAAAALPATGHRCL